MKKVSAELQTFLQDFGLTDKEIQLYLTLLRTGPNTIMNLARETGIKRSTTHNNVEELVKKGLVSQTNFGERRMVVAENPEKLQFLVEQKRWNVKRLEENLDGVVGLINNLVPEGREKNQVEVKYYEGKDNVKIIYDLTAQAEEVYSFANLEKYYDVFSETMNLQNKASEKHINRKVFDILVDSEISRKVANSGIKNYQAKFISGKNPFAGFDMLIFNDNVAIIQLIPDRVTAILIESKAISESLKALHRTLWELL